MKTLVTGGAGFIGSHLVDLLMEQGHEVVVIDDESAESNDKFFWRDDTHNIKLDICDEVALERVFKEESIDWVFHLAAESRIQPTLERPRRVCQVNFVGTCNILQASKQHGVKRVIYSSTSSAYGLRNDPPLKESMPRDCLNPYSVTKVAAEDLCKMYYNLWGLETVIFRYFNVYGERHPIKGRYAPVIGIFLRQKEAGEPMTIVGDGLQTRDFTHVQDVVQANLLAASSTNQDILGERLNVGTGMNHSILNIAEMIDGDYIFVPKRLGESRVTLADTTKIKEQLGWEATIKLEDWIKENNV